MSFFTKANFGISFAAISLPTWLPSLDTVSTWAGLWVPILGFCLLILQISKLLYDWASKKLHIEPKQ